MAKGNSLNGLSVNLRTLRALYNRAIKQKLVSKDLYPFNDYSIKSESTRKRAITLLDLERIKAFVPETAMQERAKEYFMLSFYLMGASFVDIAFLKVKNIRGTLVFFFQLNPAHLQSRFSFGIIAATALLLLSLCEAFFVMLDKADLPEHDEMQIPHKAASPKKNDIGLGKGVSALQNGQLI
jgi:hypothetical protein